MIKKDSVDNKNIRLTERQAHVFYLEKNLGVLDPDYVSDIRKAIASGKETKDIVPTNPMVAELLAAKEKIVKIDPDITIQGCKNPLMTMFVGFSTRKLYEALIRKKKKVDNVFFIEPDIEKFKHLLLTEDISDLLIDPNYEFVVGVPEEQLLAVLFKLLSKHDPGNAYSRMTKMQNMERVLDPFTYEENKDLYSRVNTIIDETVTHLQLSMGCSDDQFRRWEMMIENKDIMLKANTIKPLFDKFENVPIIVCGGGPSLDTFLNEAKKNTNIIKNSLIIAVDAVLGRLLKEGIRPNMVVRCERKLTGIFKDASKEAIKGKEGDTPIHYCAYPWTPKGFFDLFDNHFYLMRTNGVCVYTEIKQHGTVNGGVSSGNAALEIAFMLKSKNIFLTGIDMVEVDGKTHVDGTQVEYNIKESMKKGTVKIECNDGVVRETTKIYNRCYNEYFQAIDKHNTKYDFNVYNTSSKGLNIKNTTYKPWTELLDKFKREVNASELIDKHKGKIGNKTVKAFKEKIKKTKQLLLDVRASVVITESLVSEAQRSCDRECKKMTTFIQSENEGFAIYEELKKQEANFEKLWFNVVDAYDHNFKNKWLNSMDFRIMFLDILQLDTYFYENQVHSLSNLIDKNSSKYKEYTIITKRWMEKIKLYCDEFIRAFAEYGGE